ncbi:RNA-binding protein [Amorphus sp. 3PC139-8]|uniref:RNA-binding protein n=1 Tax=Amorphus sp. 3PC139-8 TaxID=2735676 RepID=UPI00345CADE8
MPRKNEPAERQCLVTREVRPVDRLIRFVCDPEGRVVPDIKGDLPGRGVWVTATREAVDAAERKRLFGRGFKAQVTVEPGLAGRIEVLLTERALASLGLARKAGSVVDGFQSVEAAIGRDPVVALVEASDGAADGRRKIRQAVTRRFGREDALPLVASFNADQLSLALGRGHVIHACLKSGRASSGFLERVDRLERFRIGAEAEAPRSSEPIMN